jgi:hypothetical protein
MVLSRENIEAFLTTNPSGTALVRFADLSTAHYAAEYTLVLKVARVP